MANSPAGVQIYLATTFVFTFFQSMALRNDTCRSLVDLPPMNAPKPEAKLAKEFLDLTKKEREAFEARGGNMDALMKNDIMNENAMDATKSIGNTIIKPVVGKGVLAPGFTASFPGTNTKSSLPSSNTGDNFDLPKPSMMNKLEGGKREATEDTTLSMPNIPLEVMEAANEGKPMPRPIQMAPKVEEKMIVKDGKEIAMSLKKKKQRKNVRKKTSTKKR